MMESQTLEVFTERVSRSAKLKFQAGLAHVCPSWVFRLQQAFRQVCQGRLVCLLVLVLAAPILYLVFGAFGVGQGCAYFRPVVYSPFSPIQLWDTQAWRPFCFASVAAGSPQREFYMVIRDLPGWLQKLVQ